MKTYPYSTPIQGCQAILFKANYEFQMNRQLLSLPQIKVTTYNTKF